MQHRLYIVDRPLRCTQKLLWKGTHKCSTGSIYLTDTSGSHKSSCRQTRLGASLALVDRQSRFTTSCCRPSSGTAQAAVEQIHPGEAQAAADISGDNTDCCTVEETHRCAQGAGVKFLITKFLTHKVPNNKIPNYKIPNNKIPSHKIPNHKIPNYKKFLIVNNSH